MKNQIGLGDIAYFSFRPAVYVIDWTWGTDLKDCDLCKERRRRWNLISSVPLWLAITFFVTLCASALWWVTR